MSIPFTCPYCGKTTNVADKYVGQTGPCVACGQTVTIPSPSVAPPPPGGGRKSPVVAIVAVVAVVAVLSCGGVLMLLLLPAIQAAREAARRQQSSNNLKQIGLAMHNYHDCYKAFPYAGSEDPQLRLGLSWRVRLLPFVEQMPMYDGFTFDEPWDGPKNSAWIHQMPPAYQSPNAPPSNSETVYLAVTDEDVPAGKPVGAVPAANDPFASAAEQAAAREPSGPGPRPILSHRGGPARMADIIDGTAMTILAVEADADQAVTWSRPKDLAFDPERPRQGLGKLRGNGFLALMADGSVRFVPNNTDDEVVRRMMLRDDGQAVALPEGY